MKIGKQTNDVILRPLQTTNRADLSIPKIWEYIFEQGKNIKKRHKMSMKDLWQWNDGMRVEIWHVIWYVFISTTATVGQAETLN